MSTRTIWILLSILPLTAFAACSAPTIRAEPVVGFAKLDGELAASSGAISASNELSDLGLDDSETQFGARVDFKWGIPHLTVSFARAEFSGSGTTTAQLENDGVIIPAGATVDSDVELTYGQAVLTFDFVPTEMFELGIGLGVEGLGIDGDIEESGTGNTISTDASVPIPVLAARAAVVLGPVDLSLLVTGTDLEIDGDEISFFDIDLRGSVSLFTCFELVAGYRRWEADLEYDDDGDRIAADLMLDGPYVGLSVSF